MSSVQPVLQVLRMLGLAVAIAVVGAACYPPVPGEARYVSIAYTSEEVSFVDGAVYGVGIDDTGTSVELKLDLFLPPLDGRLRPTLVLVHGGGYLFGDRSDFHTQAREWAQRGYVVATPSYRLASAVPVDGFNDVGPALNASADGQLVVKWLRANSETYDIDTERLAMIGSSAGGVVALLAAQTTDLTQDRFSGPESHIPNAVISTGAPADPLLENRFIDSATVSAPALLHHFELDTVTAAPGDNARFLCMVWESAPSAQRCMSAISPGPGHTVGVGPADELSLDVYHPFLAAELDLANASAP